MSAVIVRDRLIGSCIMGAIWTILCVPIVGGMNPVGVFLEDLGPVRMATLPVLFVILSTAFYGIFTFWTRGRH